MQTQSKATEGNEMSHADRTYHVGPSTRADAVSAVLDTEKMCHPLLYGGIRYIARMAESGDGWAVTVRCEWRDAR